MNGSAPRATFFIDALVREWPATGTVESLMRAVEVVLVARDVRRDTGAGDGHLQAAIDEMERIVGHTYAPGRGVAHTIGSVLAREGTLGDHMAAASALVTAHAMTGRLPYGMLAEELVEYARRQWWDGDRFASQAPFEAQCDATRVFCRLAALHRDPDYRASAIVGSADYAADAERALAALVPVSREQGDRAAICGLALIELFALPDLK